MFALRTTYTHHISNTQVFKEKILKWSQQFNDVVWLDSNSYKQQYTNYDAVLAVDALTRITINYHNAFNKLKAYQTKTKDWIFGYLAYDLKNDVEPLTSNNYDGLGFADLFFFQPKKVFLFKGNTVEMHYIDLFNNAFKSDLAAIEAIKIKKPSKVKKPIKISLRVQKDDYFKKIETILKHIYRGNIYETNFCQEFYAENTEIEPLEIYKRLNRISNTPFAAFLKTDANFLLSASPERYLKKSGNIVVSQPIKGTARRSKNVEEDEKLKTALAVNEKERSENIMIVDLVRNDLSKTALKGSVRVKELCRVYTFDQVHQMVSTITSQVSPELHPVDIIKATFPMGSMTGAPKISAMQIIENLEATKRGLYSGAVGYFTPQGDFDFSVVIRSILYNKNNKYVSYSVGGAITAKSKPLNEYEECLVKAKALREVLET